LWLAARPKLSTNSPLHTSNPLPIHGVVSLAGMPDMVEAVHQNVCRGAPQELLGAMPDEEPDRYVDGSPHALLPLGVPQQFVHGTKDPLVPLDYASPYVEQAKAQGDIVELAVIADAGHFEVVDPQSHAWNAVRDAVLALL